MKYKQPHFLTLSLLLFASLCYPDFSTAQDATSINKDAILGELDKLAEQRKTKKVRDLQAMVDEIEQARTSANAAKEFYLKVIFATRFDGAKGETRQFHDWKEGEGKVVQNSIFQNPLQLHLDYLAITLHRQALKDAAPLIPDLVAFVHKIWDRNGTPEGEPKIATDLLTLPISEGVFAKYYQIEKLLKQPGEGADWEEVPSNTDGILDKTVFPEMRRAKNKEILSLWEERIELAGRRADESRLTDDKARFELQTLPQMTWNRAKDQYVLGEQRVALDTLMNLLRQNQLHPSYESWLSEVRSLIGNKPASTTTTKGSEP